MEEEDSYFEYSERFSSEDFLPQSGTSKCRPSIIFLKLALEKSFKEELKAAHIMRVNNIYWSKCVLGAN